MSKEACVVILDVGRGMGGSHGGVKEEAPGADFEAAKSALRMLIQQKLLFTKRDEMGLVLVGTDETANLLNEKHGAGYENIVARRGISVPDLDFLESIDSLEVNRSREGDVVDALLVAMDMINSRVKQLKFSKRIFLITDGSAPVEDDPGQLKKIAASILKNEFHVNVVGVGFSDDEDEDEEEGNAEPEDVKVKRLAAESGRTELQVKNERILRRLCDQSGGAVLSTSDALQLLSALRSRSVNQVSKMRGPLVLGSKHWPVWTYGKTMQARLPSLSKKSLLADASSDGTVKMDRTYWNKLNEAMSGDPVEAPDRIRAYRYGKDWVSFPEEAEAAIKTSADKGIVILGFAPRATVPRQDYLGGADVVVPEPGNLRAGLLTSALAHACFELQQLPIVRYVKRLNSAPALGVLEPLISTEVEGFYFNQLPFAEDIREFPFHGFVADHRFSVSPAQLRAAGDLIDAMDLDGGGSSSQQQKIKRDPDDEKKEDEMDEDEDEDDESKEMLDPHLTFNPVIQRFYQNVEARALDPSSGVADLNPVIAAYVNPDAQVLKRAGRAIQRFKSLFPLTPGEAAVAAEKSGEKRHWRDLNAKLGEEITADADMALALQNAGQQQGAEGGVSAEHFDALVARAVEEVGTVTPVQDMKQMMDRRDRPMVEPAISGMLAVVQRLVRTSFNDQFYAKALDCVRELRTACVAHSEARRFNQGLTELRAALQKAYPEFWTLLAEAPVLPISSEEDSSSDVSADDAAKWYGSAPEPSVSSVEEPAMQDDDDDMWGDMN